MGRESNEAAKYLPLCTVVQDSLGLPTGLDRGSGGQPGAGAGPRDPVPTPLVACPPQEKSGNWPYFGHFSQRGSFSLMPRTFLNPALTTHPSKQPLIKQKEQREGAGRGRSWGRDGQAQEQAAWMLAAQPRLARSDGMDGQQAPELEVLDHRELLQALRGRRRKSRGEACTEPLPRLVPPRDPGQPWRLGPVQFPKVPIQGPGSGPVLELTPGFCGRARLPPVPDHPLPSKDPHSMTSRPTKK